MRVLFLIFLTYILYGCTQQSAAPIKFSNQNTGLRTSYLRPDPNPKEIVITEKIVTKKVIVEESELDKENRGRLGGGKYRETIADIKPDPVNLKTIYYEVQKGDNIEEIAQRYETSVHDIAKANELIPPYKLDKFQILKIKVSPKFLNKKTRQEAILEPVSVGASETIIPKSVNIKYIAPVQGGRIIKHFGEQLANGTKNKGIDIKAAEGSNVQSVFDGTVITAGNKNNYGNFIIVKNNDSGILAAYCHLRENIVAKGDVVSKGDTIGYVGKSGDVDEAELYFALKKGETPIDPSNYLPAIEAVEIYE